MNVREFAIQLRATIAGMKEQNIEAVESDNLIAYLDSVVQADDSEPSAAELEQYKAQLNLHAAQYQVRAESDREMFKSVILAGQNALRTGFLLNGGASVALLAVISSLLIDNDSRSLVEPLANALVLFVLGTFAIALSSAMTYLSQLFYSGEHRRTGTAFQIVTILLGFSSFGLFCWGMLRAYEVFSS